MSKRLLLLLIFVLISSLQTVSARQPSFEIQTITVEGLPAYDLKVSPDGQLAAAYVGPTAAVLLNIPVVEYVPDVVALPIHLIDLTTGEELGLLTGATDYVSDVAFTPGGKQMVSYHRNGEIFLWDVTTQSLVSRQTSILGGSARIEFLPHGKTLLIDLEMGFIGNFLLWDIESGSITKIWHKAYDSFGEIKSMTPDNMESGYAAFDLSPDGKLLATASRLGEVVLWDMSTLEETVLQQAPEDKEQKLRAMLGILSIAFSSDGKRLVYFDSSTDQTHIWDVATQTETEVLSIGSMSWAISPQGGHLAWVAERRALWFADVAQPDGAIKVLDFQDGLLVARPTLTFTPDGSKLIVGGFFNPGGDGDNVIYIITLE